MGASAAAESVFVCVMLRVYNCLSETSWKRQTTIRYGNLNELVAPTAADVPVAHECLRGLVHATMRKDGDRERRDVHVGSVFLLVGSELVLMVTHVFQMGHIQQQFAWRRCQAENLALVCRKPIGNQHLA